MREIGELEERITAALDRIRRGAEAARSVQAEAGRNAETRAALESRIEEERVANAQLEERVRALKERQEGRIAELEAEIASERARSAQLDRDLQALRGVNAELREVASDLRSALEEGVGDAGLVNRAVLAELEGLAALREADRNELDAILAELRPLIGEGQ